MRLIIRIDDVGYSKVHNIGSFAAIDRGIATAVDLMLDCSGTEEALYFLKDRPWISVGWHTHFWGKPVLPAEQVPTLIRENGRFKIDMFTQEDVSYDEAYAELQAELEFCKSILGRYPGYCATERPGGPFADAFKDICDKYDIVRGFGAVAIPKLFVPDIPDDMRLRPADEKWRDRGIFFPEQPFLACLFSNEYSEILKYGEMSMNYLLNDEGGFIKNNDDRAVVLIYHPGYIDEVVMFEGEESPMARHFDAARVQDVYTLCSKEVKDWIAENNVELLSMTDAMYGKNEYQAHLEL